MTRLADQSMLAWRIAMNKRLELAVAPSFLEAGGGVCSKISKAVSPRGTMLNRASMAGKKLMSNPARGPDKT
jgi:hypothetical protein